MNKTIMLYMRINYQKIISTIGFICLSLAILIAYGYPAKGYELSIYTQTPLCVWILLAVCIICGLIIIFNEVINEKKNKFWLTGFLLLLLTRISLLYLPFVRGYYTWDGDNISHIGYIKNIVFSGHFANENFYPITHSILAIIKLISNVSIETVVNYSTAFISAFFVISIYLLSKTVLKERNAQILSVAAIAVVFFNRYNMYLMPNGWSVLLLPFVVYLFFKSYDSLKYRILMIIALVIYPFFHPLSSVILAIILLTIGAVEIAIASIKKRKFSINLLRKVPIIQILILLVILVSWILSFKTFEPNIRNLYQAIITGASPDVIASMGETLDKINVSGVGFVQLLIKIYGDEILFIALTFFAVVILLKKYLGQKQFLKNDKNLISLLSVTFVIGIIYFIYLFNIIPGLGNLAAQRLLAYLVIFTPIFAGYVFWHLMKKKNNYAVYMSTFSLLIMVSALTILNIFPSPYVIEPNPQVTQMDMHGFRWIISNKNDSIKSKDFAEVMSPPYRYTDAIVGHEKRLEVLGKRSPKIPDHFNYNLYRTVGESFEEDKYLVLTKFDKIVYDTVWDEVGRFSSDDFVKLNNDITAVRLYCNGECDTWKVQGVGIEELL